MSRPIYVIGHKHSDLDSVASAYGYARLLQRNLRILNGSPTEDDLAPLRIATGSGPVLLLERRAGLHSALIGVGTSSGVGSGAPLAVPEGLVGRVVTAGRTLSRAQLLLDASAAAGARIVRTGELGIVRGDGRGALRLNHIPTTSRVRPGDLVESAGIDGIYPRGVAIGRVASVSHGGNLFLDIVLVPTAPFSRLTDVLVLAPFPAREPGEGTSASR